MSPLLGVLAVVALWWGTTGLIYGLGRLPPATFRWSLAGATGVLAAGIAAMAWSATHAGTTADWCAFGGALAAWCWLETTFVLGAITGPRREGCEPGIAAGVRFRQAVGAILHHELAGLALLGASALLMLAGPNHGAFLTLLLLWGMRLSAKLNLHLGVPNAGTSMLPAQLRYLAGYFRERAPSALFPVSVAAAAATAALLWRAAWQAGAGEPGATLWLLLATLATLGLAEHLMLLLPMPAETLWTLPGQRRARALHGAARLP